MPISLVNGTNFFVVIIALIVVFFLLGILFGLRIQRSGKKAKNTTPSPPINEPKDSRQVDAVDQNSQEFMNQQDQPFNQPTRNYRNQYYRNYW